VGIAESEMASSAQLKDVETMVAGMGGFKTGRGDGSEGITVGNGGSVCVDIDAEEDGGMIGENV
jgi:hypothetical protein